MKPAQHLCWHKIIVSALLFIALLISTGNSHGQNSNQSATARLLPAVMLLLEEGGPIQLRVGQEYTDVYSSDRYPDEIKFQFPRIFEDVRLSITLSDIPAGAQLEIYINGELIDTLNNGVNVFSLPASELSVNNIEIKLEDGTTGSWLITSLSAFLTTGPTTRSEAQLFLARATFGPTKGELDRVLEIGYEAWIDEQLQAPRVSSSAMYMADLEANQAARRRELEEEGGHTEAFIELELAKLEGSGSGRTRMDGWWQRAIQGNDQLRQRMVYALSQIIVVSDQSLARTRSITFYEDVLAENAFGNYFDLLKDVTLNPAMGRFLGFSGNQKSGQFGEPDENYAREIMQLFSIGLLELELDGTPKIVNGQQVDTYNQDTIRNLARVFTGWTFHNGSFVFDEWDLKPLAIWANGAFHDFGSKTLLNGQVNAAGLSQDLDLDTALRNIYEHPNVGPFIAKRLIERMVMSNPPPTYVARVATVFNDNGAGVRGDMGAVVKAILLDPSALNSPTNPNGGKIKEPILAIAQAWRAFNAISDIDKIRFSSTRRFMGQRPYSAATVFNFYAPDDSTPALVDRGLVAPELTLYGDDIVPLLLPLMLSIATSEQTGNDDLGNGSYISLDTRRAMLMDLGEAEQVADSSGALLDFYDERLFGGYMSDKLREVVTDYLATLDDQGSGVANRKHRAQEALTVLLVSPEYNYQR